LVRHLLRALISARDGALRVECAEYQGDVQTVRRAPFAAVFWRALELAVLVDYASGEDVYADLASDACRQVVPFELEG
jgi:hypothetical protein